MPTSANILENNAIAAMSARAPAQISRAIHKASAATGVDFAYLMEKAAAESGFEPRAKAKTSSATGLFQFIESTWLEMIEKHGAKYGFSPGGKSRQALLELRKNTQISAFMAAEYASDNQRALQSRLGNTARVGPTELYFAHFMGAGGAGAFLEAHQENPGQIAAGLFPKEAAANRNVFYDSSSGQPRTLQEIYAFFDRKFSKETGPAAQAGSQISATIQDQSHGTGQPQPQPQTTTKMAMAAAEAAAAAAKTAKAADPSAAARQRLSAVLFTGATAPNGTRHQPAQAFRPFDSAVLELLSAMLYDSLPGGHQARSSSPGSFPGSLYGHGYRSAPAGWFDLLLDI